MNKTISYNKFVQVTILVSMSLIIFLFLIYGKYVHSNSIEKSIQNDAKVVSSLVFQNIYTVMKNGGNKTSIQSTIEDIQNSMQNIEIKIVKRNPLNSESIKKVFEKKEIEIVKNSNYVDIISPLVYKGECLQCHVDSKIDEVAAVTLIKYPILSLKITLKEIIVMASSLFIIVLIVFFISWYYFLSKYFVKPIRSLTHQIKTISSHKDLEKEIFIDTSIKELKHIETTFNEQNKEILDSYKELEIISNTDALTKIYNRKKFMEYSAIFINNSKRYDSTFSLVLIDLNKFKYINDNYGHDVGDDILILFTQIVLKVIRESDYFFRTGGDEFIILLSSTLSKDAKIVIDKIKTQLKNEKYIGINVELEISASFGISQFGVDGEEIDSLVKIADERMYEDKKESK